MTLAQAIKAFARQRHYLEDPLCAKGVCSDISGKFLAFLKDNKVPGADRARAVTYAYNTARHYPLKVRWVNRDHTFIVLDRPRAGGCFYHVVVKLDRLRIDFTARQFHPQASFPLVWRVKGRRR